MSAMIAPKQAQLFEMGKVVTTVTMRVTENKIAIVSCSFTVQHYHPFT